MSFLDLILSLNKLLKNTTPNINISFVANVIG